MGLKVKQPKTTKGLMICHLWLITVAITETEGERERYCDPNPALHS